MIEWTNWLREELARRALADVPHEACGLISGGATTVLGRVPGLHLWGAENAAESPTNSFLIAPTSQLAIVTQIAERKERLLGVYHSHPNQGAAPSDTDRELARLWPGLTWLIVGLDGARESIDVDELDYFAGVLCPE